MALSTFHPKLIFKLLSQNTTKALKAYNTVVINRFHRRTVHNTEVVEIPQDAPPKPSNPELAHLSFLEVT